MKITIEHYGNKIGINDNMTDIMMVKKQVQLLLTIGDDESKTRSQFILNKENAETLLFKLEKALKDPILAQNGFQIV